MMNRARQIFRIVNISRFSTPEYYESVCRKLGTYLSTRKTESIGQANVVEPLESRILFSASSIPNQNDLSEDHALQHIAALSLGPRTSPFSPDEPNSHRFVVDSDSGLDTGCSFSDLTINLEIDRYVGDVMKLYDKGLISPYATITMPAFDVDVNGGSTPEVDGVFFNGERVGTLTGDNNIWIENSFQIDVRELNFATENGTPGQNIITIAVDELGGGWCTAIDWVQVEVDAIAPPALLVHGILSDKSTWNGPIRDEFFKSGIAFKAIDLSPSGAIALDSIQDNAADINRELSELSETWGVDKFNIVAHSKGGIDAREAAIRADYIDTIVQIGTPNAGSPLADYVQAAILTGTTSISGGNIALGLLGSGAINALAGVGGIQLTTSYMNAYNLLHGPQPDVTYHAIAGNYRFGGLFGSIADVAIFSLLGGPSDTVVPVSSVYALPGASSLSTISTTGSKTDARHAFGSPSMTGSQLFVNSILPLISHAEPASSRLQSLAQPNSNAASSTAELTATGPATTSERQGILDVGTSTTYTMPVDGTGDMQIVLTHPDGVYEVTLTSPSGRVITASTADTDPDIMFDSGEILPGLSLTGYNLTDVAAERGTWEVLVSLVSTDNPLNQGFHMLTAISDQVTIQMDSTLDASTYQVGDIITLTTKLTDAETSILDATVQSIYSTADGITGSIAMLDNGTGGDMVADDGIYTAQFANTSSDGIYSFVVQAVGANDTFERSEFLTAFVSATSGILNAAFNENPIDDNTNTLYDRLQIGVGINAATNGRFRLSGDLTDESGNVIDSARVEMDLMAGVSEMSLEFDGETIYDFGVDGPYTVTNLVLFGVDPLGDIRLDQKEDAHVTSAYLFSDFEHEFIQVLGTGVDDGIDNNSNGLYDILRVNLDLDLEFAGNYTWTARLRGPSGFDLGLAAGSGNLPAGPTNIALDFAGLSIGTAGIDGPYTLDNLTIIGPGTSILATNAYTTSFYSASEFEGFVAPGLTGFTLIDANEDVDLAPITDGQVIDLAMLGTRELNIRADGPTSLASVVFELDGPDGTYTAIEKTAPFALFGNDGSDYKVGALTPGQYTLTATEYDQAEGQGKPLSSINVTFEVADSNYISLVLVDARSGLDLFELTEGMVLNSLSLPAKLNIRADINQQSIGSVEFKLNNERYIENNAVYALFGDNGRDYFGKQLPLGINQLTITPYSAKNGKGSAYSAFTIHFEVINSAVSELILIDPSTQQDVMTLVSGQSIDLASLPSKTFNVRVDVVAGFSGSIQFKSTAGDLDRIENAAPYTLFGDKNGIYFGDTAPKGLFDLEVIPFEFLRGKGERLPVEVFQFDIIDTDLV